MKILIALDATPSSAEIVKEAAARPWPIGTRFFLLHVLDPFPFVKAPISLRRAKEDAETALKNAAQSLVQAGWRAETGVILSHPRSAITKSAASWKADLVMMGSYNAAAITRLLLGSTAQSVLRGAPCPVEIVRAPANGRKAGETKGMRILVASDGSKYSTAAARFVAGRPWPQGTEVKVLVVPEPFFPIGEFPYFSSEEIEKVNATALKQAKMFAEAGAAILSKAKVKTTTETAFPQDAPARMILKEADGWRANLIVLGSHGRRGFDRLTLGSVSEHVAFHAPCSVEVVREPGNQTKKSRKGEKP